MLKHGVFPDLSVGNTIVIIVTDNCYWAAEEESSDPIMMDNLLLNIHKIPIFLPSAVKPQ